MRHQRKAKKELCKVIIKVFWVSALTRTRTWISGLGNLRSILLSYEGYRF